MNGKKKFHEHYTVQWDKQWDQNTYEFAFIFSLNLIILRDSFKIHGYLFYLLGRIHTYMTSDVFRAFFTYLRTLIRYFTT